MNQKAKEKDWGTQRDTEKEHPRAEEEQPYACERGLKREWQQRCAIDSPPRVGLGLGRPFGPAMKQRPSHASDTDRKPCEK